MSSRPRSTRLERVRFGQLIDLTTVLIERENGLTSEEDSSDSSCSLLGDEALRITLLYDEFINTSRFEANGITFGRRPVIADFDNSTCISCFRFRQDDLQHFSDLLWTRLEGHFNGPKESVEVENRYRVPFETGILLFLYCLARPHTLHCDMEGFFGMRKSHISAAIRTFVDVLYLFAYRFLNDPSIYKPRMPVYASLIEAKIGIVNNIWGFIDRTLRKIC